MRTRRRNGRLRFASALLGLLLANGCAATIQQNLDIVLASSAVGNALLLPTSGVAPLAAFFVRLSRL